MKINKLKVTENLRNIICVPLVGVVMATSISGCSEKPHITSIEEGEYDDKLFNEGEHIISIPIDDPTEERIQYEYHPGYKPVGISISAYGQGAYHYGQGYIMYSNELPVKCQPTHVNSDNEELLYTDFGTPIDYERETIASGNSWKEFSKGEHVISVPVGDMNNSNYQVESYDGYEVVGIATSEYGKGASHFGGSCILYVNKEKVRCARDLSDDDKSTEDKYTTFGTPIETNKTLRK